MGNQHERPAKAPDTRDERGRYALKAEWIRTETVINVGLIVLGVYILQAFMSTGVNDVAARVAIVAWAVAIPQLAFLALLNQVQGAFRYFSYPWYFAVPRSVAYMAAVAGFAAALWRLWVPGSLVLIASGVVACSSTRSPTAGSSGITLRTETRSAEGHVTACRVRLG